jgi:GTP pyrophosphokinase
VLLLPAQRIYIAQIMGIIAIFTGVASFVLPSSTFIGRPTSKGHVTPYHNFGSRNGCSIRLLASRKNIYTSRNETQVNTDNTSSYATSAKETGFSSVAAQEVEETLTASSPVSQMNHAAHQEHNGQYLGNKMDFIQCECQDDTFDGSRQKYDDLSNELFVSLVEKIRAYNPEAVEGIDLSRLDEDDGDSLTLDGIMPVNGSKTDESPGLLLLRAYQYAMAAHAGQCRKSGEPYITHPLGVAHIIADLKLDTPSLLTALLHDTVEDTSVTLQNITDLFSSEIAHLVDGVTKVGKLPFTSYEERQSENYRKMILAMSQDIRVVLVKLADRAHNMRTLQYMPAEKQKRIATETHEIYVPLAHRLGIHWLKTELEDECFQYLHPEQFESLKGQVSEKAGERKEYEMEVVQVLEHQMKEAGLGIDGKTLLVSGRTKGLYSIYTKMERQNIALDDVYDKIGFRIIVDDVASCYQALGIIHSHWKPAGTGKIKDYIALPKPNGYKSLHTTIIGPRGKRIEVQIRTSEMHEVAESGIAAHWTYKQKANRGNRSTKEDPSQFTWLRELMAEVQRQHDPIEFIDSVKEDLYAKEVFVFSPKGDLYALSRGSSVLDFAYLVHSDLGNHCAGAKVRSGSRHLVHLHS